MSKSPLKSVRLKPTPHQRKLLHEAIEARELAYLWAIDTYSDEPYDAITQDAVSKSLTAFKKTQHGSSLCKSPDVSLRAVVNDARSRLIRIIRDEDDVPLEMTEGERNRLHLGGSVRCRLFRCFIPKVKWVLAADKLPLNASLEGAIVQYVAGSDQWLLLFRDEAPDINNTEKTAIHKFLDKCEEIPVSPRPGALGSAWQWVRSLWTR